MAPGPYAGVCCEEKPSCKIHAFQLESKHLGIELLMVAQDTIETNITKDKLILYPSDQAAFVEKLSVQVLIWVFNNSPV